MDEVRQIVTESCLYEALFDVVRLVDPLAGTVVEVNDGRAQKTEIDCVAAFQTDRRCKYCTSLQALYSDKQTVKLEYRNGSIFLVISAPIRVGEQQAVVELVKDITETLSVDKRDASSEMEIPIIIDKLNKKSKTDQLTQLLNRRYIDDNLPALLENTTKVGRPLSVAMLDIDHFKKVNDAYGHPAGDYILKSVAGILPEFVRLNSDFVARYGGEEFLLCLPGTDIETCRRICERIREVVERKEFKFNGHHISITISIGLASSEEVENLTQDEIVQLADRRLYLAKARGRNQVVST
ncbi:MAG: GGDEF domain-containing protein [Candidatus Adiutrix sp.]|jgi:diguanylate cyclase (GGDEF)-like protein|nr:GGDEF domain-containing protein [Candidatus Adiutrix sp.]